MAKHPKLVKLIFLRFMRSISGWPIRLRVRTARACAPAGLGSTFLNSVGKQSFESDREVVMTEQAFMLARPPLRSKKCARTAVDRATHYGSGTRKIAARGGTTRLTSGIVHSSNVRTAPPFPTL